MATLYVGLGSNLGNREEYIHMAIHMLSEDVGEMLVMSPIIETKPVGFNSLNNFLNCAAAFSTTLPLTSLLRIAKMIEERMGRTKRFFEQAYSDRIIDIDLLMLDDTIISTADITLPHPRLHERLFVLAPLANIASRVLHPVIGKPIGEIYAELVENTPEVERPEALIRLTPDGITDEESHDMEALMQALSGTDYGMSVSKLRSLTSHSHVHVYLYRRFGVTCGTFTLITNPAMSGFKVWFEDFAVMPHMQGKRIGRIMLGKAIEIARTLGADKLYLTSRPERSRANALYATSGFVKRNTNLYVLDLQ